MPFQFRKTEIDGLTIIEPHCARDDRGYYKKYYEENIFRENGLPTKFSESSDILSSKGVLRGLHFQTECSQGKLLHVLYGEIYDVALDLRINSKTFGQWKAFYLNSKNFTMIYIPEGFAHGFMALEDNTMISYQSTGKYVPTACDGILWNDKELNISWPIDKVDQIILADKDKIQQTFAKYKEKLGGNRI